MPCPFGFTADDEEEEEVMYGEEGENVQDSTTPDGNAKKNSAKAADGAAEDKGKGSRVKDKAKDMKFDFNSDPVSWFYQNQIKSEAEFQEKKTELQAEARRRLDALMGKKGKSVVWPEGDELDGLSIASSELSELDDDVHSVSSMVSCADSWIEEQQFTNPGRTYLRYTCIAALVVAAYSMSTAYGALSMSKRVVGIIMHSDWPTFGFVAAIAALIFSGLALLSTSWRSKRLLLGAHIGLILTYAGAVLVVTLMSFQPTEVDHKLKETACKRLGKTDQGSKLCAMIPTIEKELVETVGHLIYSLVTLAVSCVAVMVTGIWYMFEICYIHNQAVKHKRRHRRRKHTIPWEKIKIVGPVMNCGAGGAKSGKAGATGGCPVMSSGPKDKNA